MNFKTIDNLLQRATHLGLAFVVTLGMLGGIDTLAQGPQHEAPTLAAVPAAKA